MAAATYGAHPPCWMCLVGVGQCPICRYNDSLANLNGSAHDQPDFPRRSAFCLALGGRPGCQTSGKTGLADLAQRHPPESLAQRHPPESLAQRYPPESLAQRLVRDLQGLQNEADDRWLRASAAEVALGQAMLTGETASVESALARHLFAPGIQAFEVASTLRQFTEVWDLDTLKPRSSGSALRSETAVAWALQLLDMMRARLLQLPGGLLQWRPAQLAAVSQRPAVRPPRAAIPRLSASPQSGVAPLASGTTVPTAPTGSSVEAGGELEALLSQARARPMSWRQGGITAARSVALVQKHMGQRLGSGFLLRAGDLGLLQQPDDLLLLTNFHVVNTEGLAPGVRPEQAEVLFEAADPGRAHAVVALLWQSPVQEHDAALLRLGGALTARPAPELKDEDRAAARAALNKAATPQPLGA